MAGNYNFGVARVLAALRPLDRRLTPAAWLLARRCLLALAEQAAKHTVFVPVPAQPLPCRPPHAARCACSACSAAAPFGQMSNVMHPLDRHQHQHLLEAAL